MSAGVEVEVQVETSSGSRTEGGDEYGGRAGLMS